MAIQFRQLASHWSFACMSSLDFFFQAVCQIIQALTYEGHPMPPSFRYIRMVGFLMLTHMAVLQIMGMMSNRDNIPRPDIPDRLDCLPGGTFDGMADYVDLMRLCWAEVHFPPLPRLHQPICSAADLYRHDFSH